MSAPPPPEMKRSTPSQNLYSLGNKATNTFLLSSFISLPIFPMFHHIFLLDKNTNISMLLLVPLLILSVCVYPDGMNNLQVWLWISLSANWKWLHMNCFYHFMLVMFNLSSNTSVYYRIHVYHNVHYKQQTLVYWQQPDMVFVLLLSALVFKSLKWWVTIINGTNQWSEYSILWWWWRLVVWKIFVLLYGKFCSNCIIII